MNKALHGDDPSWEKVPDAVTEVPVTTERYVLAGEELREIDSDWGDLLATYGPGQAETYVRQGDSYNFV